MNDNPIYWKQLPCHEHKPLRYWQCGCTPIEDHKEPRTIQVPVQEPKP